jgi:hypothetical protein
MICRNDDERIGGIRQIKCNRHGKIKLESLFKS